MTTSKSKNGSKIEVREWEWRERVNYLLFNILLYIEKTMEKELNKYINMLQEVQDTLTAVQPNEYLDEAILKALRDVGEIKAYFKNSLP